MMNKWIQAFEIFAKYEAEGHYVDVSAEHDEVFAGPDVSVVSEEDIVLLDSLGWSVNREYNSFVHYV